MRKLSIITATVVICAWAAGCAGVQKMDLTQKKVVTLEELREGGEELLQALTGGDGLVIKIASGEKIPVKISTDLPFLALEVQESHLEFTQETYMFISSKGLLLSPDGEQWAPVYKTKAIKKLWDASQGSLQIGLSVSKEDGPAIQLGVALK